jgi:hypothetical protein
VTAHVADPPVPKLISNPDFNEICKTFKIPVDKRNLLRQMVDGSVTAVAEAIIKERSQPHRRDDRKRGQTAIGALKKAQRQLKRLGPLGHDALIGYEHFLGPMVSAGWLRQQLPGDNSHRERVWKKFPGMSTIGLSGVRSCWW